MLIAKFIDKLIKTPEYEAVKLLEVDGTSLPEADENFNGQKIKISANQLILTMPQQ